MGRENDGGGLHEGGIKRPGFLHKVRRRSNCFRRRAAASEKFVEKLFKLCGEEGIHTCCETTLYASWSEVKGILPYTELFISDIKHMDSGSTENIREWETSLFWKISKDLQRRKRSLF